jgi:hypothetical protein
MRPSTCRSTVEAPFCSLCPPAAREAEGVRAVEGAGCDAGDQTMHYPRLRPAPHTVPFARMLMHCAPSEQPPHPNRRPAVKHRVPARGARGREEGAERTSRALIYLLSPSLSLPMCCRSSCVLPLPLPLPCPFGRSALRAPRFGGNASTQPKQRRAKGKGGGKEARRGRAEGTERAMGTSCCRARTGAVLPLAATAAHTREHPLPSCTHDNALTNGRMTEIL